MSTALKVLVVDDSEDDVQLLLRELARSGFTPQHQRAATADELSAALQEQWDAIIVDYHMPGFGGLAALSIIRYTGLDIPTILVSGKLKEDKLVEAMRVGAHDCIQKDNLARLGSAIQRELADAEVRRQRRAGIERIQQLNLVLLAIRNVNQLIVTVKDRTKLLQGVCECLIETRGYHSAWIILLNAGKLVEYAEAGADNDAAGLAAALERGAPVYCLDQAVISSNAISVTDVAAECGNCPLVQARSGKGAISCRLAHAGTVYGVLTISVDPDRAVHTEELSLFSEVAHDIGLALHAMELEERRLRAERELQLSEERYRRLAEETNVIPWEVDAETESFTYMGAYVEQLMGYPRESWLGPDAFDDRLHPDDRDEVLAFLRQANQKGQSYADEIRMIAANGNVAWLRIIVSPLQRDGQLLRIVGHAYDITEKKIAEDALRESEERYRQVFEKNPIGIYRTTPDGRVLMANPALVKMLGFSNDKELLQLNLEELGDQPGYSRAAFTELIDRDGEVDGLEAAWSRADGSTAYVRENARAVFGEDGAALYYEGTVEDITERRKAEEAVAASELQYRRLFEAAKDGILILDAVTGLILDVNPFLLNLIGFEAHDIVGKELWELGLFKDIAENKANFLELQDDAYIRYENLPLQTSSGKNISVEFISNAYWVTDRKVIQCNIRDITARVLAEEALRASEDRFRTVVESSADALVVIGRDGLIDVFNPAAEEMFGISAAEALDQPPDILMAEEFSAGHAEKIASYYTTGKPDGAIGKTVELQARRADGTTFPVDLSLSKGQGGKEEMILAIIRDITERKQVEEAALRSATKFRTLYESSNDAVMILNGNGFLDCNSAALVMFGCPDKAEFCSKHPADVSPANQPCGTDSQALASTHIATAMAQGGARFEWVHRRLDTDVHFPVEVLLSALNLDGRRVVQAVVRDISERKEAEQALGESAQLLQLVVDTIPVRVFWKDRDFKFLGCNTLFANDADLDRPDQITGKSDYELSWHADAEAYRRDDRSIIASGVPRLGFEERQLTDDGRVKWLRTSKVPLRDADGRIIGILGCYDDITETRLAQEELTTSHQGLLEAHEQLKLQQQQLIHAEKMASLGQLAAGVAHEINNPIAFIKSNLGTFQEYLSVMKALIEANRSLATAALAGNAVEISAARERVIELETSGNVKFALADASEMIEESIAGANRVRDIVQDLRSYVHAGKETPVEAGINEIIQSSLRIVSNELKYKCTVTTDLRPLPMLLCYPERLNQVFVNLLVNAAYGITDGGKIEIATQATDSNIIIRITDNGPGITPEVVSKIFDPFFTTKEVGMGTGLGLAISHTTVLSHGGTIEVQSEPGKFTTFTISLPLVGVMNE